MGKKISNFLKGEIVSSVFYLAFGLCLILIPDQTVNIICKIVFGLVMIAAGVYHIAIYAAEKEKATILDLFTGVIVTVLWNFSSSLHRRSLSESFHIYWEHLCWLTVSGK